MNLSVTNKKSLCPKVYYSKDFSLKIQIMSKPWTKNEFCEFDFTSFLASKCQIIFLIFIITGKSSKSNIFNTCSPWRKGDEFSFMAKFSSLRINLQFFPCPKHFWMENILILVKVCFYHYIFAGLLEVTSSIGLELEPIKSWNTWWQDRQLTCTKIYFCKEFQQMLMLVPHLI